MINKVSVTMLHGYVSDLSIKPAIVRSFHWVVRSLMEVHTSSQFLCCVRRGASDVVSAGYSENCVIKF